MTTYKDAGVNVSLGDLASEKAYAAAKKTFKGRQNHIGKPLLIKGGYSGALDMRDYYLVQNDDGIGTKMVIAEAMNKFDTVGYDLLCMVSDDAVCLGAEVISVSNTIDVHKVDPEIIDKMMKGLQKACLEHKIVVPGGEIAELGNMVSGYIWNATAVGIVEKQKLILGKRIKTGDLVISFREPMLRSNGFTLARHILQGALGDGWIDQKFRGKKWGETVLQPSKIYHSFVLDLHGRYGEKPKVEVKGVAHITGGGIPGNIPRILPRGLGVELDNLFPPADAVLELQRLGNIPDEEAYQTWSMGNGMMIVCNDFKTVQKIAKRHKVDVQIAGHITKSPCVRLKSQGAFKKGKILKFS